MLVLAVLAAFFGSTAEAAAFNWLALGAWRRSLGQHWSERARLLYPAIRSIQRNLIYFPLALGIGALFLGSDGSDTLAIALGLSALLGAILGSYAADRELFPHIRFGAWLHLVTGSWLLALGIWLPFSLCVFLMPENYGLGTWLDIAFFFAFSAAFLRGFQLRLLRALRLVRPAPEHLQSLVSAISAKMHQPVRAAWVRTSLSANAFAYPVTGELVFTTTLIANFSDEEIQTVCAHELGHLGESRSVIVGRIILSFASFPLIFTIPVVNQFGPSALIGLLLLFIAILRLGLPLRRRMEKRADRIAADFTPDPAIYARALEHLYQVNHGPAVMPHRSAKIHPNLYDRMIAAGVTPDFPKPLPPSRYHWTDLLILLLIALVAAICIFRPLSEIVQRLIEATQFQMTIQR